MSNTREEQSSLKEFYMKKFFDWLNAETAMGELMRRQNEEIIAAHRGLEKIKERIKQDTPLHKFVTESILSYRDPQKFSNLICQQMTLISLVKDMRAAQRDYYKNKDIEGRKVAYQNMINKEYKVDEFLKSLE